MISLNKSNNLFNWSPISEQAKKHKQTELSKQKFNYNQTVNIRPDSPQQ